MVRLREWESAGGLVLEDSVIVAAPAVPPQQVPTNLDSRHFHRTIDTAWRRTSYSGLIRVVETPAGVTSEPEVTELDDEVSDIALPELSGAASGPDLPSPMADLPMGAKFGTLVHAVLETADPFAADLAAELESQIREHAVWWPVDVSPEVLAAAMVPMHDTPLGPLADGVTLRQIGLPDRLRELDFEFPLAGGDLCVALPSRECVGLAETWDRCCASTCAADDPDGAVRRPVGPSDGLGGQPVVARLSVGLDRRGALRMPSVETRGRNSSLRRGRLQDELASAIRSGAPLTAADYGRPRLRRGDVALGLSTAGAAVLGCAAPVPAVAATRLPPVAASGWGAVPVCAGHVRPRHANGRWPPVRGVQLAAATVSDRGVVGPTRCGAGGRMTVAEVEVAVGATGTADLQRCRGP